MESAETTTTRTLGPSLAAGARGIASLVRGIPRALVVLLVIAVALRVAMWFAYHPAMMNVADTAIYLRMADGAMFADPARTAGYSMFLDGLHLISDNLDFTITFQHIVLGIGAALLLYATVIRTGAPRWAAVAAAAAILLPLDQIQLEHTVLSESLFILMLIGVLYASVRSLDEPRAVWGNDLTSRHLWIVAAGVLLGLSAWVRAAGAPLVPFLALWLLFAIPGTWRARLGRAALATVCAAALILTYFQLNAAATDHFGLTRASGWALYARTAPFADCSRFDPPAGTDGLCEATDPGERNATDYYAWVPESPAWRLFGGPPEEDDKLGAFGRQAILNQPVDYGWVVVRDFGRFFFPGLNDEQLYVSDYNFMDLDRRDPVIEQDLLSRIQAYYPEEEQTVEPEALTALTDLQQVLRIHPLLMFLAAVIAALGIRFSSGRVRWSLVLLLGVALLLLLIPAATAGYSARYAIPVGGPLIAASAVGLWVIIDRLGRSGQEEQPNSPART